MAVPLGFPIPPAGHPLRPGAEGSTGAPEREESELGGLTEGGGQSAGSKSPFPAVRKNPTDGGAVHPIRAASQSWGGVARG